MHVLRRVLFVVAGLAIVPVSAFAQNANASISGTVKDSSGAVLPGVTVEASSPVLIEKVRTAITDGTGQYRIVDLLAGTYTVTVTSETPIVDVQSARRQTTVAGDVVAGIPSSRAYAAIFSLIPAVQLGG